MPETLQNARARLGLVLVDTSVWVDFIRSGVPQLSHLLTHDRVLMHDMVIGEIACGSVPGRRERLAVMGELSKIEPAEHLEVLRFIEKHRLFGCGIGYVDNHLLASVALMPECRLWSRDKRLHAAAQRLGCSFTEFAH